MFAVGIHGVFGLYEGNNVFEQVVLKRLSPTVKSARPAAAPRTSAFPGEFTRSLGRDTGIAVGKNHDHRLNLFISQQVVYHGVRVAGLNPFAVIAADAV